MQGVFWLTIIFVLASGLSAYIGNEWGRKIGKRKLSVFSLRPRHTSTFLSILLAMAFSLGLFGTGLLLVPDLNQNLMHADQQAENQYQKNLKPLADAVLQLSHRIQREQKAVSVQLASAPKSSSPEPIPKPKPIPKRPTVTDVSEPLRVANQGSVRATTAVRKVQVKKPTAPIKLAQLTPVAQVPQALKSESVAPRSERDPHLTLARPSTRGDVAKVALVHVATEPRFGAPVFSLQVTGGLDSSESDRLVHGLLDLTRSYVQLLGENQSGEALIAVQSTVLKESQKLLQQNGTYQINIQLAEDQTAPGPRSVQLAIAAIANTAFDPHTLLENKRLKQEGSQGLSLKSDLRLAMTQLAQEARKEGYRPEPQTLDADAPGAFRSAELPFELLNLERLGNTLHGRILLNQSQQR